MTYKVSKNNDIAGYGMKVCLKFTDSTKIGIISRPLLASKTSIRTPLVPVASDHLNGQTTGQSANGAETLERKQPRVVLREKKRGSAAR